MESTQEISARLNARSVDCDQQDRENPIVGRCESCNNFIRQNDEFCKQVSCVSEKN